MRILAVDVWGIPGASNCHLLDANVFQDYDAVVVSPESFDHLYGPVDFGRHGAQDIPSGTGLALRCHNKARRNEIDSLLRRGGIVVCFMLPVSVLRFSLRYEGGDGWFSVSNYDWLFADDTRREQLGDIVEAKGTTIEYIDQHHQCREYLNTKPAWSAYVSVDDCRQWRILASAFGTHALALAKRVESGHIILLPNNYGSHNGEVLEQCLCSLVQAKEATPQPNWARDILVPGEQELIGKVATIEEQIGCLEREKEARLGEKQELERWKYLLYEKGKHHLEPAVRHALELIGFSVEPQPDKDSDGLVVSGCYTALLEVVGSKGTVRIEKLGELLTNIGNFVSEKKKSAKGILVGNPFCEHALDDRPPKRSQKPLFAKELLESAQQQGIAVLLSTDLYEVVAGILDGKVDAEAQESMRQRICDGSGLVVLTN